MNLKNLIEFTNVIAQLANKTKKTYMYSKFIKIQLIFFRKSRKTTTATKEIILMKKHTHKKKSAGHQHRNNKGNC